MTKTVLHLPATAAGPRGVRTAEHGDVVLQPGEVREDLTLSDDELELAKTNELKSGKPKAAKADEEDEPKSFAKMNRAELDAAVEEAKANGFVLPEDATTNTKIADALQAHADKS